MQTEKYGWRGAVHPCTPRQDVSAFILPDRCLGWLIKVPGGGNSSRLGSCASLEGSCSWRLTSISLSALEGCSRGSSSSLVFWMFLKHYHGCILRAEADREGEHQVVLCCCEFVAPQQETCPCLSAFLFSPVHLEDR